MFIGERTQGNIRVSVKHLKDVDLCQTGHSSATDQLLHFCVSCQAWQI